MSEETTKVETPEITEDKAAPEATVEESTTVETPEASKEKTIIETLPEPILAENSQNLSDVLGEDFKDNKNIQKFKTVQELAKGYNEISSHLGKKFTDLTPEEMDIYVQSKGRPESIDGYEMGIEDNADPAAVDWFKNKAFELGLSNEQASNLAGSFTELQQDQFKAMETQRAEFKEQSIENLKKEYGSRMDSKLNSARKAMKQFAGEEFVNYLNETGLGDHPALIKAFVNIGDNMLEDTLKDGGESSTAFNMSQMEVQGEIAKLYKDPVFMKQLKNPADPHHEAAKDKFEKLYILKQNRK